MKICFVCHEYPPVVHGGIGTFVESFAQGLAAVGHSVVVVGMGAAEAERNDHGVHVVTLPRPRRKAGVSWFLERRQLYHYLRAEARRAAFEIIEVPDFAGWLPAAFPDCRVAVRLHQTATNIAMSDYFLPHPATWMCERRTLQIHRHWIAPSAHILRFTTKRFGIEPLKAAIIPHPILVENNLDLACPVPDRFVLFAGTLTAHKGAFLLARAARGFLASCCDLHMVYAGKITTGGGISADKAILDIVGERLAPRVHFLGHLPHPAILTLMARATVFVLPSLLESFGLAAAEAMAQGCPVILSDIPPFRELVQHARTGLLFNPTSIDVIARAVAQLYEDDELRTRLGEAGRRAIQATCSMPRAIEHTIEFYSTIRTATRQ